MNHRERITQLFEILGTSEMTIDPPDGGWTYNYLFGISDKTGEGIFSLTERGSVNYRNGAYQSYSITWQPLQDLAFEQLKAAAIKVLLNKSRSRTMPNLHRILVQYYGLA